MDDEQTDSSRLSQNVFGHLVEHICEFIQYIHWKSPFGTQKKLL